MIKNPVISIIIPVYNAETDIGRCIKSVLAQSFSDFELLLINDGSTDKSGEICEQYALKDKRIHVLNTENGGQSAARNIGLDIAKGNYLGFIDADDYIDPDMFKTLYDLSVDYNADISECGYISVFEDEEEICEFGNGIEYGEGDFLLKKFIDADIFYGVWSKLFKKALFQNVRFPTGRIYEDTWMVLYFCLHPLKFVRTQKPYYYYDQRVTSTLRSDLTQRKAREFIYILESQLDLIDEKLSDEKLKTRLNKRIMEKSVYWYMDLVSSKNNKIHQIYSRLYLRRMDYSIMECWRSTRVPLKYKVTFMLCKAGLLKTVRFLKNQLS